MLHTGVDTALNIISISGPTLEPIHPSKKNKGIQMKKMSIPFIAPFSTPYIQREHFRACDRNLIRFLFENHDEFNRSLSHSRFLLSSIHIQYMDAEWQYVFIYFHLHNTDQKRIFPLLFSFNFICARLSLTHTPAYTLHTFSAIYMQTQMRVFLNCYHGFDEKCFIF